MFLFVFLQWDGQYLNIYRCDTTDILINTIRCFKHYQLGKQGEWFDDNFKLDCSGSDIVIRAKRNIEESCVIVGMVEPFILLDLNSNHGFDSYEKYGKKKKNGLYGSSKYECYRLILDLMKPYGYNSSMLNKYYIKGRTLPALPNECELKESELYFVNSRNTTRYALFWHPLLLDAVANMIPWYNQCLIDPNDREFSMKKNALRLGEPRAGYVKATKDRFKSNTRLSILFFDEKMYLKFTTFKRIKGEEILYYWPESTRYQYNQYEGWFVN